MTLPQRTATGLLIAALVLFGAACGSDDDDEAAGSGSQSATTAAASAVATTLAANTITIQNFTFMNIDNAKAGATWTITNSDTVPHTVSAVDGSFVWAVAAGATPSFPKTLTPGSYPIRCDVHPTRMMGTLVVK